MPETPNIPTRTPRLQHIVRTTHTGAKHLISNFDTFHPPAPKDQKHRSQPLPKTNGHDAEFVSTTPVQPPWKAKNMSRALKVDLIEQYMEVCLAWEGETVLEVTTYRKPAGSSVYLKINGITYWKDGYEASQAFYEPLLDDFRDDARGGQWKTDVLRIVDREDDRAWWHVQESMWKFNLRDPYKMGWKAVEPAEQVAQLPPTGEKRRLPWMVDGPRELGTVSKRRTSQPVDEQAQREWEPAPKGKRRLPWSTDAPAQKKRKAAGSKTVSNRPNKPSNSGKSTLSDWVRGGRAEDADDEEPDLPIDVVVKMEAKPGAFSE